jgi:hypothetical protein
MPLIVCQEWAGESKVGAVSVEAAILRFPAMSARPRQLAANAQLQLCCEVPPNSLRRRANIPASPLPNKSRLDGSGVAIVPLAS